MLLPTLLVEAVPGCLMPHPTRVGEFVGLRKLRASEPMPEGAELAHAFHDGPRFVASGPVLVPRTIAIERALLRGDLRVATSPTSIDPEPHETPKARRAPRAES